MQPGAVPPQNVQLGFPGMMTQPLFLPQQPMQGMPTAMAPGQPAPTGGMAMPQNLQAMYGGQPAQQMAQQYWQQYWQYMMYWQMQQQQQQQQPQSQSPQPPLPPQPPQLPQPQGPPPQQQQQAWGIPQPNDQGLYVLFVYHLPHNVSEEMLRAMFGKYGTVNEVVIMRDNMNDPKSRTKGFGFVKYRSYDEAATAVQYLNGAQLENKRLEVSFKLPKGNKRNTNQNQNA